MFIAIMSDVHDSLNHMQHAIKRAKELGCTHLIYLGDFVRPHTLQTLLDEWKFPLDFVLGNNEYEPDTFKKIAMTSPHVQFHGYHGDIELQGRRIFFTHMPHEAIQKGLHSGCYSAVFYGHTHAASAFTTPDKTLMVNPGEIMGRREEPGFAVYCPTSNTVTFHKI